MRRAHLLALTIALAVAACSTARPPPLPHWEHLPPPGYDGD